MMSSVSSTDGKLPEAPSAMIPDIKGRVEAGLYIAAALITGEGGDPAPMPPGYGPSLSFEYYWLLSMLGLRRKRR
jgi:hypothetical protein